MGNTGVVIGLEAEAVPPSWRNSKPGRSADARSLPTDRPRAHGKFLFFGEEKFWVKGVSYGAFRPDEDGRECRDQDKLDRDFAKMASLGINTVRIPYTMPPRHLLDIAQRHGLRVIVGLSAEQHVGDGAAASGTICAWASATGIMFSDATAPSLRSCQ